MSQNFDLLNQIEAEFLPTKISSRTIEQGTKAAGQARREITLDEAPSKEIIGLAQTLFLSGVGERPRTVVFSGVDRENGSSEICFQLGRVLASFGKPVCLLDADVVSSSLSRLASLSGSALVPASHLGGYSQISQELWLADVRFTGIANDGVLITSQQLNARLADLRRSFEYILIDAPAARETSDAAVLGQVADGVVLVIEANKTRKAVALHVKRAFEAMNVRLLGTVLRDRTYPIPESLYRVL